MTLRSIIAGCVVAAVFLPCWCGQLPPTTVPNRSPHQARSDSAHAYAKIVQREDERRLPRSLSTCFSFQARCRRRAILARDASGAWVAPCAD